MSPKILLKEQKNQICALTLNRPEKKNSLSLELVEQLGATLQELAEDDGVRAVILRGAGDKAFCSGFDMAREIADNAPLALKGIKSVINMLIQTDRLDEVQAAEAQAIFKTALTSQDLQEGQAAFLEKREPHFKGK